MKKLIKMGLLSLCITMFMTVQTLAAGTTFGTTASQNGEFVEMSVVVTDATAYSGEIIIKYDAKELQLVAALTGADATDSLIYAIDSATPGKITIGFADVSKVIQGEVFKLKFKVLTTNENNAYSVNVGVEEWSGQEINSEEEELAYSNYDMVVRDGKGSIINMDTDGDGTPDVSVDKDGDGKADINVDTDGDGEADVNIDTDGDGTADKNIVVDDDDDNGGSDNGGSDNGGSDNGGSDNGGSDNGGSDNGGSDNGGSGNGGSSGDDEEGDSSEDEGTTGDEGESGDEGEDEGTNNEGSTSKPDNDTQTNTDVDDDEEKQPAVWPFIVGGVVVIAAVVGFFFFKKKSA